MEMINLAPRPAIFDEFLPNDPLDYAAGYNPGEILIGLNRDEGTVFTMPTMQGEESTVKPFWDEATFKGTASMWLDTTDELVLDMTSLIYGPPKTVRFHP